MHTHVEEWFVKACLLSVSCWHSHAHAPLLSIIKEGVFLFNLSVCVANCAKWSSLIEWKIVLIIFPESEQ